MTKDELLELLLVERHLPLPIRPARGLTVEDGELIVPADTRALQHARRSELSDALDEFEKESGRKRATKDGDQPVQMVKRRGIWVAEQVAA